jgi:transmembrane sensor
MKNFEQIDELIAKVISGEASATEHAELDIWISQDPANARYMEESRKLFAAIDAAIPSASVDADAAWSKLERKISDREGKVISIFTRRNFFRAAASILIILTFGFLMYRVMYGDESAPLQLATTQKTSQKLLPDGSKVFMNRNSEVVFVEKDGERKVQLKGEAYFEVKHNEKRPFIISIGDIMIKDIGTSFNVKALPGTDKVEVLVEEGEVQFYSSTNEGLNLVKGEKAIYDGTARTFNRVEIQKGENAVSYKSKVFHFEGTSLSEVLQQVNEVYGTEITVGNKDLGHCKLSVMFNNEDIEVILAIIVETLDLQIERHDGRIILKGQGCGER